MEAYTFARKSPAITNGARNYHRNARVTKIGGEGVRSKWNGEPPYREIDFGFVFVRAVRAGEAKLRGRARESLLWLRRGRTK